MARFVYRLQKVYELRERRKKEQEQRVIEAQNQLRQAEIRLEEKKNEIRSVRKSMLTSPHTLMAMHDEFLHHLNGEVENLYQDVDFFQGRVYYEKAQLLKAQAELEALSKHREKAREEWLEEEKKQEMKMLDEIAGQRYFRAKAQQEEDGMIEGVPDEN